MNQIVISFIVYFAALILTGFYFLNKNKSEKSFLIANRSLNYWVTAISAQTSDMSSWLFLGYTGAVFSNGLSEAWTAIGLVIFMYLNWHFVAPKLRQQSEEYKIFTLSGYFEKRINDKSNRVKILSAIISIIFFTLYLSSGLVGIGKFFESAFNINYYTGISLGTLVTIAYILIGGFFAVAWCNLFQGIFLLAVIILVPTVTLSYLGGISAISAILHNTNISISLIPQTGFLTILFLTLSWGLGYFGQAHILVNFMSIKNPNEIKKATFVGITWQILVLTAAIAIGIIGIAYFNGSSINPEHVFILMVKDMFSNLVAGFALCAILAATLSTINTQLVVAVGNVSQDIYPTLVKNASNRAQMFVTRIATFVIAIIAMLIAFVNSSSLYNSVLYAWSGLGAAFGPLLLLSLYTKKVTPNGALAGILTGTLISIFWPLLNSGIPQLVPGFFGSLLMILLISKKF